MYPYIYLFGEQITSYGIMILIGYFAGFIVIAYRIPIYNIDKTEVFVSYILAGFGALIGGKLFYAIQGLQVYFELNKTIGLSFFDYFIKSGLVYYGGFIGCIIFIIIAGAIFKINYWQLIDTMLPALPLGQAIGRIGCFMVGCCYGIPFDRGFDMSASPFIDTHEPLLPIQLIESVCVGILFIFMMIYGNKPRQPGKLLGVYMIGYGFIRFVLEFFRGDLIRGIYGAFSVSQWISIAVFVIGITLFVSFDTHKTNKLLTAD